MHTVIRMANISDVGYNTLVVHLFYSYVRPAWKTTSPKYFMKFRPHIVIKSYSPRVILTQSTFGAVSNNLKLFDLYPYLILNIWHLNFHFRGLKCVNNLSLVCPNVMDSFCFKVYELKMRPFRIGRLYSTKLVAGHKLHMLRHSCNVFEELFPLVIVLTTTKCYSKVIATDMDAYCSSVVFIHSP